MKLNQKNKKIKLYWIPAHCGINGNEMADSLAKQAIQHGIDSQVSIPVREFKCTWKDSLYIKFKEWCLDLATIKGKYYFNNFYSSQRKPWFSNIFVNRKTIVIINRIRSGHTTLRKHLFRINIIMIHCVPVVKLKNIFWNCDNFSNQRMTLIRTLKIAGQQPWGLHQV